MLNIHWNVIIVGGRITRFRSRGTIIYFLLAALEISKFCSGEALQIHDLLLTDTVEILLPREKESSPIS